MEEQKKKSIRLVVDTAISAFAEGLISRYSNEVDDVKGVINNYVNSSAIIKRSDSTKRIF